MKKIVLSGFFGYNNAGDEAILLSLIQLLKEKDYQPIVLSANPEKTASLYQVEAVHRMKLIDVFRAIRQSDGLLSGGGSLLQDVTSARNSFYYLGVMQIAHLLKKPVFVYAQGIGPLSRKWLQRLTARQLNKATYVSVRDESSQSFLTEIGVNQQIDLTVDPVLGLQTKPVVLKPKWQSFLERGAIVCSLRAWEGDEKIVSYYKAVITSLNEKGIPVIMLPFHQPEDTLFSEKVAKGLDSKDVHIIREEISLDEQFAIIQQSRLVYGVRLHSLIFAASVETPFVGLSYDPKIDSFLALYDDKAVASTSSYNVEETVQHIMNTLNNHEAKKKDIAKHNKLLKHQLFLPMTYIDNFYAQNGLIVSPTCSKEKSTD